MSKLLEKINALKSHRDTVLAPLEAKSDQWTAEDRKAYEEGITKAEALKSDISLLEKASGIDEFMASGAAAQVAKDAAGMEFEGKAGTTTIDKSGKAVDEDGAHFSSKTLLLTTEPSYKAAFGRFLRSHGDLDKADWKTLRDVSNKAMQEGLDAGGGVLVPVDILTEVLQRKAVETQLMGLVRRITTGRDKISLPRFGYDTDDIASSALDFQWVGENGPAAEDTSLEDWDTLTLDVFTGMFQVEVTRDILEDAFIDAEAWVSEMIADAYRVRVENLIVNGSGINRPRGFLSGAGGTKRVPTTNVGNPVSSDGLIGLDYALPEQYSGNSTYVCRKAVAGALAQIKEGTSQNYLGLIGSVDARGLANPRARQILGSPLVYSEFMPSAGSGNNILAFGDFRQGYAMVERIGMTIEPYGQTDREMLRLNRRGFHVRTRIGGDVFNDRALRIGVQS